MSEKIPKGWPAMRRGLAPLVEQIRALVQTVRQAALTHINTLQVMTNFEIGRRIVQHEQQGAIRAEYGTQLLKELAERLTKEMGKGFSRSNLQNMRNFFLMYRDRHPEICQKPSGKLPPISQMSLGRLLDAPRSRKAPGGGANVFTLGWSHYIILMGIKDERGRRFYEIEAAQGGWSVPEFKRQVNSSLYERLALSRDKKRVQRLAKHGHVISRPDDMLKNPYVLEFLGLREEAKYSESDLESAIIGKLQKFLLELGKGFLFESRQQRFTFGEDHFFVDLVFYNRLLKCYVLIDLKIGKVTHQDLGQMQMYVNHFDRHIKKDDEHPTVGIILCKKKHDALVEITLPKDANIFASEYRLYLPSKEDLRQRLIEWTRDSDIQ